MEDLTGLTFHGVTVVRKLARKGTHSYYECRCVCGALMGRQPSYLIKRGKTERGFPLRCVKCNAQRIKSMRRPMTIIRRRKAEGGERRAEGMSHREHRGYGEREHGRQSS